MILVIFFTIFGIGLCCSLSIFCAACGRQSLATHSDIMYSPREQTPDRQTPPPIRQTQPVRQATRPVRQAPTVKQNKVKIQPERQPLIYKGKEEKECSICLENIHFGDFIKCCNCSHCFHKECIERWLENNKTCPLCRRPCRF